MALRAGIFIFLLCGSVLKAAFTPEFKALYDQAGLHSAKKDYTKALLLLNKTKPLTAADSGLYCFLKGSILRGQKENDSAEQFLLRAIHLLTRTANYADAADAYNDLGSVYQSINKPVTALEQFQNALKMFAQSGDSARSSGALHNICIIYFTQKDFMRSAYYARRASKINLATGNTNWLRNNYIMLAKNFMMTSQKDSSLHYCKSALKIAKTSDNKFDIAFCQHLLGVIYGDFEDLKNARIYFDSALVLRLEIKDTLEIVNSYGALGELMLVENKIVQAKKYIHTALQMSYRLKNIKTINSAAALLLEIAQAEMNYKDMYTYYKLMRETQDSIMNARTTKLLLEKEYQFNYEKKEHELKVENEKKILSAEKEKEKQQIILFSVAAGLAAMAAFSLLLFNRLKVIRRQKKMIEEQQRATEQQKQIVEQKQKEILDSIRYAKRIQNALITNEKSFGNLLKRLLKN